MTHLFGPRSFHQLWIDDLLPALLTLYIGAVREVQRDEVPPIVVLLHQLFQPSILQHNLPLLHVSNNQNQLCHRFVTFRQHGTKCD